MVNEPHAGSIVPNKPKYSKEIVTTRPPSHQIPIIRLVHGSKAAVAGVIKSLQPLNTELYETSPGAIDIAVAILTNAAKSPASIAPVPLTDTSNGDAYGDVPPPGCPVCPPIISRL